MEQFRRYRGELEVSARSSLGVKSPIFSIVGVFSGVPYRTWWAPALAPLLPNRLGCFVCTGHSWVGSLGLVWVIVFGVECCGWAVPWVSGGAGVEFLVSRRFMGVPASAAAHGQEMPVHPKMGCWWLLEGKQLEGFH